MHKSTPDQHAPIILEHRQEHRRAFCNYSDRMLLQSNSICCRSIPFASHPNRNRICTLIKRSMLHHEKRHSFGMLAGGAR